MTLDLYYRGIPEAGVMPLKNGLMNVANLKGILNYIKKRVDDNCYNLKCIQEDGTEARKLQDMLCELSLHVSLSYEGPYSKNQQDQHIDVLKGIGYLIGLEGLGERNFRRVSILEGKFLGEHVRKMLAIEGAFVSS